MRGACSVRVAMSTKRSSRNHPSLFGVVLNELPQTENGVPPAPRPRAGGPAGGCLTAGAPVQVYRWCWR